LKHENVLGDVLYCTYLLLYGICGGIGSGSI